MSVLGKIMDGSRILIFTAKKRDADELTRTLRRDGFPALCMHGDKKQQERNWVLSEFKKGKQPIMVATDVAARGLGTYSFNFLFGPSQLLTRRAVAIA